MEQQLLQLIFISGVVEKLRIYLFVKEFVKPFVVGLPPNLRVDCLSNLFEGISHFYLVCLFMFSQPLSVHCNFVCEDVWVFSSKFVADVFRKCEGTRE